MRTPEANSQRFQDASTSERSVKRQRLTLACTECRKRKVKCDAETPMCKNCRTRGLVCETNDPRHPELLVARKYGTQYQEEAILDRIEPARRPSSVLSRTTSAPVPLEEAAAGEGRADEAPFNLAWTNQSTSWVARSYEAHQELSAASITRRRVIDPGIRNDEGSSQDHQPHTHESPDMAINRDSSAHRQKIMGGSSLQSLTMFLDVYLQRAGLAKVEPCFRHGMAFAEEFVPPLTLAIPNLPPPSLMDKYLQAYTRCIHPLYPVLDIDQLQNDIKRIRSEQDAGWSASGGFVGLKSIIQTAGIPVLACVYAVISLGADEAAGCATQTGDDFLSAAHGLFAHLIGLPHLNSVQSLVLITLALRGRAKEGQAFHVLGAAIRMSHSIGLHRNILPDSESEVVCVPESRQAKLELDARIWWSCYALERLIEVETTRPSAIPHGHYDHWWPTKILCKASQMQYKYFLHWVALAVILERISELLYRRKRSPESTFELLQSIGTIDKSLRDWKNALPEEIRPDGDIYCDHEERPFAVFLALHYHQTVATLHRASIVLPRNQMHEEIENHASQLPFHQRLRKGADLCLASACATIKLCAQIPGGRLQTPLHTLTQILHGCVVLAISILRRPQSPTVRSDLELLITGSQLAEAEYKRLGQHPKFFEACTILRSSLSHFLERHSHGWTSREMLQTSRVMLQPTLTSSDVSDAATTVSSGPWETLPSLGSTTGDDMNFDFASLFDGVALEDLWTVEADGNFF